MKLVEENELENEVITTRRRSSSGAAVLIEVDFADIERAEKETKKLIPNESKELSIDFEGEVEGQEWQPSELLQGVPFISEGDITLQRKLGSGAFGVVYQAKYKNSVVAFKELNITHAKKNMPFLLKRDPKEVETLLKEAFEWETLGLYGLKHPHIVEFITLCKTKDHKNNPRCGMMMKFCDGGNLEDLVEKLRVEGKRLSTTCILRLALEIAAGLRYLHGEGLVHHDLKTANILIHHFKALLADLGLAQKDALVQPGAEAKVVQQGIRDCLWISPEEFRDGPAASTPASDIYAFGLILFHLLSARKPYEDFSDLEIRTLVGTQGYRETIPAYCPDPLKKLITQCWHQDPLQRPSIEVVITQLKEAVQTLVPNAIAMLLDIELDIFLHQHRPKLAEYRAPFATPVSIDGDIDDYWQRLEAEEKREEKEIKEANSRVSHLLRPESVEQSLMTAKSRVSVLFGEGGLGKTLTTYRLADQSLSQRPSTSLLSSDEKKWRFIFLRTAIQPWSHHHLDDAIDKTIRYLGLEKSVAQLKELPLVFVVDDYSNLQRDAVPKNLPTQIGLQNWPHAKLFVTTRREGLTGPEEFSRFEMDGHLDTFYLLPSSTVQLMTSLRDSLSWNAVTEATFTATLEETSSSRAILRNPFLRSLFIQSYALISKKKDLKTLTRADIYDCATEHWLEHVWNLLDEDIQMKLLGSFKTPAESFNAFVEECVTFPCYQDPKLIPSRKALESLESKDEATLSSNDWFHLTELLVTKAKAQFAARQEKDRAIFTEKDYVYSRGEQRAKQFMALSLLTEQEGRYGFIHKSAWEHFVARRIVKTIDAENLDALTKALNTRNMQEELGVIEFIIEKLWPLVAMNESRKQQLLNQVIASKNHPEIGKAASNAMTLLIRLNYCFSDTDILDDAHIPNADCSRGVFHRAKMRRAELDGVNFTGAYLQDADASESSMKDIKMGERTPLWGHALPITAMAYDATHHLIATGSGGINRDNGIRIWDAETGILKQSLPGHTDVVVGLAFLPNKPTSTLISISRDKTLSIWDVKTDKRQVYTLTIIPQGSLTLSLDGKMVAFISSETKDEIIGVVTEKQLKKEEALQATKEAKETKEEKISEEENQNVNVAFSQPNLISLFSLETGKVEQNFEAHTGKNITALSFVSNANANSKTLKLVSSGEDHRLLMWEVKVDDVSSKLNLMWEQAVSASTKITITPDGEHLVTLIPHGAMLWTTRNGCFYQALRAQSLQYKTTSIACSEQYIAVGDGENIQVFDKVGQPQRFLSGHTDTIIELIFTNTLFPLLLSASRDKSVRVWEVSQFSQKNISASSHTRPITAVELSPDERNIFTSSMDGTVKVWETQTGRLQRTMRFSEAGITALSVLQDYFAVGDEEGFVHVWNRKTDRLHASVQLHQGAVSSLAINDAFVKHLASGGKDARISLWDIDKKEKVREFDYKGLKRGTIQRILFSKVGLELYTMDEGTAKIWNYFGTQIDIIGEPSQITQIAHSIDGKAVACVHKKLGIELWQLNPRRILHTWPVHETQIKWLNFDKSGRFLSSGGEDNQVWDKENTTPRLTLTMSIPIIQGTLTEGAHHVFVNAAHDLTLYGFRVHQSQKEWSASCFFQAGGRLNVRDLNLEGALLSSQMKELLLKEFAKGESIEALEYEPYALNRDDRTPLLQAIKAQDEQAFRQLLKKGVDVNQADVTDWTPLQLATLYGLATYCRLLCEASARVDQARNNGATPLYIAAQNGHCEVVELLISKGVHVDQADEDGHSPLYMAAQNGHRDVVDIILAKRAHVDQANKNGATPLYIAAANGHREVVELLISKGARVDQAENDGYIPLCIAAQNGYCDVVELLLEKGAPINQVAQDGYTPLLVAAQNGHRNVVDNLLIKGACVDQANKKNGYTPLFAAAQDGHCEVIKLLLAKEAHIDQAEKSGFTPLMVAAQNGHCEAVELLISKDARVDQATNDGCTPLYIAAQKGHRKVVELLIAKGAHINQSDNGGYTPLYLAAHNGYCDVVGVLLAKGAHVDQADNNRYTPLCVAARNGHRDVVELLISKDAHVDHADKEDGYTPLSSATHNGYRDVVELLLAKGAHVDQANKNGATPLYIAAHNGHCDVVKLLLANGADVDHAANDGSTPLCIAAENGYCDVVELLLAKGAHVDQANKGTTPLSFAAYRGHYAVVDVLLAKGAYVDQADKDGYTPLFVAAQNGHRDVVELLLAKDAHVDQANNNGATPLFIALKNGHRDVSKLLLAKGAHIFNVAPLLAKLSAQHSLFFNSSASSQLSTSSSTMSPTTTVSSASDTTSINSAVSMQATDSTPSEEDPALVNSIQSRSRKNAFFEEKSVNFVETVKLGQSKNNSEEVSQSSSSITPSGPT